MGNCKLKANAGRVDLRMSLDKRLTILFSAIVAVLIGCGRAPDLVGVDNTRTPAASVADASKQTICPSSGFLEPMAA